MKKDSEAPKKVDVPQNVDRLVLLTFVSALGRRLGYPRVVAVTDALIAKVRAKKNVDKDMVALTARLEHDDFELEGCKEKIEADKEW